MNEIPDGKEEIPNAFTCQMADGTVFRITNPNWQKAYELRIPVDKRTWFTDLVVESSRAIAAFKKELSVYANAKGSVQFPINKPMPLELISKIVKFRVKENINLHPKGAGLYRSTAE